MHNKRELHGKFVENNRGPMQGYDFWHPIRFHQGTTKLSNLVGLSLLVLLVLQ